MATIRKRNGKYQVQIRIKNRYPVSKTFLTQKDAQRWAREVERHISLGNEIIKPFEGSFSDLLYRYEHSIVPFFKGQPQEISLIRRIRSRLGKLSVREIDAPFLSEYRDRRLSVVSAQTAKHEINCVRRVLKLAQTEWNIYLPNGVPSVRLPKIPRGRTRRLTKKEEHDLLTGLKDPISNIVCFALETAMRRSEILSLTNDCIDWANKMCRLGDTKNGLERFVPLSGAALNIIGSRQNSDGALFPVKPDTLSQAFARACKRLDIENLRFHDLRHEAISRLFEKGLSVPQVAAITGHQDYRMLARYVHLNQFELK